MSFKKTTAQKIRGWGTSLDYQNKIPTKYIGKSFHEPWHDDIEKFNNMSNKEKWEMGYWVENQAYKKSGKFGFVVGLIIGIILTFFTLTFLSSL